MVLYRWGIRRRGKTGNHGKVEVKRKWWVLAHPPYSPQGNRESTYGEMMEYNERGEREEKEKCEEINIVLEKRDEEENQDYVEAIIDTECRASTCGEL